MIDAETLEAALKRRGACMVGYADISIVPSSVRAGLPRAVGIAVALDPRIIRSISSGPTADYLDEYHRRNAQLDDLATHGAELLREAGHRALPQPATVSELDMETLATPLPHKTVATRGGMGWIGKCALLVTPDHGSAVRFCSVLTDAPLPVATPFEESRCGSCTDCVDACPASAPTDNNWRAGMPRDEIMDAWACCRTTREQCVQLGLDAYVCGICIAACPWTRRHLARSLDGQAE